MNEFGEIDFVFSLKMIFIVVFCFVLSGLAVQALAGIKQENERSMSISPPMSINNNHSPTSPVFTGMHHHHHATTSAMGLLTPQFLAANQTAAALMAAGLPMSLRAQLASSGLFSPHHPLFGGSWGTPTHATSPAASPTSPNMKLNNNINKKHNLNNNNNHIVSTTTDILPNQKKAVKRKQSTKKDVELSIQRDIISPGPISPPTSGSSPQSTDSIEHTNILPTSVRHHDPSRDKVFTCKVCNRSFGYKHVLQNHERTHTGEKPFECPECHKRFTRDHHLKTHMRLHTGEKPYSCQHCDRQFVQVANLRRHLRVHTGERPYKCDICDAKFSDSNQLKAHVLIHNNEKPLKCDHCNSRFRRPHHLRQHKCGMISPPTPAVSPVMSLSDQKSDRSSRSEASDESLDLSKSRIPLFHQHLSQHSPLLHSPPIHHSPLSVPLDLSTDDPENNPERRNRKSRDIRRLIRIPPQIMHVPTAVPVQTEPEDLSMHTSRSPTSLISHDEDLDELDDAASLYIKHKIQQSYKSEPN